MSAEREFIGDGVAPSFPIHIERRRRRTPLQVAREVIVEFNRRIDDPVQRKVWPKTFESRPEPPIDTLVGDVPNFSAGRTFR
jgi:hypothetical protein